MKVPKIVKDDPWLNPYRQVITDRMQHCADVEAHLTGGGKQSLYWRHKRLAGECRFRFQTAQLRQLGVETAGSAVRAWLYFPSEGLLERWRG